MAKKINWKDCKPHGGASNAVYGLGFLGAAIYYLTNATSILAGLIGIVKAIFWPAFVVYGLLKFLGL
jgi:hypothetical protein